MNLPAGSPRSLKSLHHSSFPSVSRQDTTLRSKLAQRLFLPEQVRRLSDCDRRWVLYNVPSVPELENLTSEALLARFASDSAEDSFAELVRRHLPMVYRTALRLTRGDAHLAEDVSQIVFADLWRKARNL